MSLVTMPTNCLYYGDNLPILREHVPDESVDLVYLDPPFNSNRSYNVLYHDEAGDEADAQITAFDDTWHWGEAAEQTYRELLTEGSPGLSGIIGALRQAIGTNQMMAYLVMMAARLAELHRVLKPTGSLYLHCDPSASHYLKVLLDAVFGAENFRNEIVWRRSHPKGHAFTRLASTHDVILAYTADAEQAFWSPIYLPHDQEKAAAQYSLKDRDGRRYQLTSLLNPNPDRPNLTYEFKGVTRVWRWTRERMLEADAKGLVVVPKGGKGVPRFKRYLDEQEGVPLGDWWGDIEIVAGGERLGYPTQKPVALLERIISASSSPGDLVLDPFCGCGTTIHAAQQLGRRWIGIDITHLSIALLKYRLKDAFGLAAGKDYAVVGEPQDVGSARQLAEDTQRDARYQFQWWALSLVRARPLGGPGAVGGAARAGKKGADRGIDGVITFIDDNTGVGKRALVQVKSGHVTAKEIRDLRGTVEREKAQMGVFITLEEPTGPMEMEAVSAGYYHSPGWNKDYPLLQIVTVKELLAGAELRLPPTMTTFRRAEKAVAKASEGQGSLFEQSGLGHSLAADHADQEPPSDGA